MDEVYADYLAGLFALRKRIVDEVRRKLNDGKILDDPPRGARSKPTPRRKRG
jgi:hypothetical protein